MSKEPRAWEPVMFQGEPRVCICGERDCPEVPLRGTSPLNWRALRGAVVRETDGQSRGVLGFEVWYWIRACHLAAWDAENALKLMPR